MRQTRDGSRFRVKVLAGLFFCVIFILIIVSLLVKFIFLLQQSSFDGQHDYNLFLSKNSQAADIISFAPDAGYIHVLHVVNVKNVQDVGRDISVFPDGWMRNALLSNQSISLWLFQAFTHFPSLSPNRLTIIDTLRLYLFSRTVPNKNITIKTIFLNQPENEITQIVTQLFTDNTIYHEGTTIAIINATDVSGIGSRLAKLLTVMGANIISVTTSSQVVDHSNIISSDTKTYTAKKLHDMLGFTLTEEKGRSIADNMIILGKDSLSLQIY